MATDDHHLANGFYGGVIPTKPQIGDHLFSVDKRTALPTGPIDLRTLMPPPTDQGQTGSCGAHASTKLRHVAVNQWRLATNQPLLDPETETFSELWTYYWARKQMGTFPQDSGVDNPSLLNAMMDQGFVLEGDLPWHTDSAPYDIQRDLSGLHPPSDPYYGISGWERVGSSGPGTAAAVCASLSQGRPVLMAIAVYQSLVDNVVAPMPRRGERLLGYHDIPIHTWIPDPSLTGGGRFGWRVSWAGFGDEQGDAWLPAAYVDNAKYCLEVERII